LRVTIATPGIGIPDAHAAAAISGGNVGAGQTKDKKGSQGPTEPFFIFHYRISLIREGWTRSCGRSLGILIVHATAVTEALLPALAASSSALGLIIRVSGLGLVVLHTGPATAATLTPTAAAVLGRGDIGAGQTEGKNCC
jgi:hypothetical protein